MPKITIDADEGEILQCEVGTRNFEFIKQEQTDSGRWTAYMETIVRHKETKKFYSFVSQRGLTECQECEHFDGDEHVDLTEVEPVETKTIIYKEV